MYGMDISNYQSKIDLTKGNYDFCIIKATEGIGFTDGSFEKFAVQLTEMNKLIGCYHYARPDLHRNIATMEAEANWFIKRVDNMKLLGKAILVLDWEKEPMDREELVSAWCDKVERETGIVPFIYGSRSKINQWKNAGWEILNTHPLWIASWPSKNRFDVGVNPNLKYPSQTHAIWQYTASGKYPDFAGNVDLDLTEMDAYTWDKFATPRRLEQEKEIITPAMQWCIDKGFFAGDGNGNYMVKEPLTREQAAQVIYNIFHADYMTAIGPMDMQIKKHT